MAKTSDPLRILILGLNFSPELTGIGKFTGELAAYLSELGHEIHVVTTLPYYPHWEVAAGYRWWCYRREDWDGIQITRCPLWVPRSPTGRKRVLHLSSFALSSIPAVLTQVRWKPELVIAVAPTILSVPNALWIAKLAGARSWLHIHDFELDTARQLNMLSSLGPVFHLARMTERAIIRQFDRVSTISESMLERLRDYGIADNRLSMFPNWVNTEEIRPVVPKRTIFDLPRDVTIVLYAGNMGRKQGLGIIISAAKIMEAETDVLFVLAGDGAAREEIERSTRDMPNVRLLPLQPSARYKELLIAADIHVLPEDPGASGLVMPSKLGAMLASGRPVIVAAKPGSELSRIARDVGLVVPPASPLELARAIRRLAGDRPLREKLAAKGRAYAEAELSKAVILSKLASQIDELASERRAGSPNKS